MCPLWTMTDEANGAPLFAPAQVSKTPNVANRDALFGNVTADAFVTGQTVGVFAADAAEIGVSATSLSAAVINSAGSGGSYVPGDILSANTTGSTYDTLAQIIVDTTAVRTVAAVAASGANYTNGDTVTVNTGTMSTNAVFTVTTGGANTSIASLALTTNGVFSVNPTLANSPLKNLTVANSQANGGQATITMKINSSSIYQPGNYTVLPTNVTANPVTGGSGTGATYVLTFSSKNKGVTHTGWVKKTTGTGGRAGRVHYEVLVAGDVAGDAEDNAFPDA